MLIDTHSHQSSCDSKAIAAFYDHYVNINRFSVCLQLTDTKPEEEKTEKEKHDLTISSADIH